MITPKKMLILLELKEVLDSNEHLEQFEFFTMDSSGTCHYADKAMALFGALYWPRVQALLEELHE